MNHNERIERLRNKMYKAIDKYGLDSREVYKISNRLDKLINQQHTHEVEYPVDSILKQTYYISYIHLKKITREDGEFPTLKQWSRYAKKNTLLNSVSMEYISGLNWNNLRDLVLLELK